MAEVLDLEPLMPAALDLGPWCAIQPAGPWDPTPGPQAPLACLFQKETPGF